MSDLRRTEAGLALVLALLALMLLTFLGLTLATTTSTELQISNNYRWSQQAMYNAEAGIEIGKNALATADWSTILYSARPIGSAWVGSTTPAVAADGSTPTASTRNYENWQCDLRSNGAGFGKVLAVGGNTYLNVSNGAPALNQELNGAFTLWVRRPTDPVVNDGRFIDLASDDTLILTAEGEAPFRSAALATTSGQANRAIRVMEVTLTRKINSEVCGPRGGQVGGSSEGHGFGACTPVSAASVGKALGMPGTPVEDTNAN